ncbi:hypothetical protein DNR46_32420 [Mesorhizobium japonicum]|uniref:Uncharacterized protein n=1 Tax=Mesorhizobium japonicum TaxID=2066070 RepID=A0A3M9X1E2_9HYPH|nr:hypothetical protein DNR46_32420 [Mesorhizobium japonicum]
MEERWTKADAGYETSPDADRIWGVVEGNPGRSPRSLGANLVRPDLKVSDLSDFGDWRFANGMKVENCQK